MAQRKNVPPGAVCWLDLWTSDVEGSRNFYSELFAWRAEEANEEFGGYWMFTRDGVPVAGGMGDMGDLTANNSWKIDLATSNVSALVATAKTRGATIYASPVPVADLGVLAVFGDPVGAALGAWQSGNFSGFTTLNEHGTPCRFEPHTHDFEGAIDFYSSVFSLEAHGVADTENLRHANLVAEGQEVAGVLDASQSLPEGVTSRGVVYWHVDDLDTALAAVWRHGARWAHGFTLWARRDGRRSNGCDV